VDIELSTPSHHFGYVFRIDGAHAEGVGGGRRRPPAGFSGRTRRVGAFASAIGASASVEVLRFRQRIWRSIHEMEH
jgi:hypothetical protein